VSWRCGVRADELRVETGVNIGQIGVSSALVCRLTGYAVQRNKAIVGANAFAHEAGIHQDGMLKDAATYQIMDPEELGLTMTLAARQAFRTARVRPGLWPMQDRSAGGRTANSLCTFKRRADERKAVTLYDVFEEVPVP
jgi:2-isopropylmalate synthase